MRARLMKLTAGLTLLGVLAGGGATLASASPKAPPVPPGISIDGDKVQQGDQTSPDLPGAPAESSSESASSESAGESAVSDGPGGYADSNPNADTQFQGEQ